MKTQTIDLESRNLRVFYRDSGGDKPPLLLLHGGWCTGQMTWNAHYAYLTKYFRVISPDNRAHGQTNDPGGEFAQTFMDLAEDTAEFIAALGLKTPTIIGHSSGGVISLHLSIFYPQHVGRQILIGIHPNIGRSEKFFEGMRKVFASDSVDQPPSKWTFIWRKPLSALYMRFIHKQTNWYQLLCKAWPMWCKELILNRGDETDGSPSDYARVTCPTLLVWGDREDFGTDSDHELLHKWIVHSEKARIQNADHNFVFNEPNKLRAAILPFLKRAGS